MKVVSDKNLPNSNKARCRREAALPKHKLEKFLKIAQNGQKKYKEDKQDSQLLCVLSQKKINLSFLNFFSKNQEKRSYLEIYKHLSSHDWMQNVQPLEYPERASL